MAAGHPAPKRDAIHDAKIWMTRHDTALLIMSASVLAFLFLFHTLGAHNVSLSAIFIDIMVTCLVGFLFVVIAWKGLVPAIICGLGVVLLHNAIVLPYYPPNEEIQTHQLLNERRSVNTIEGTTGLAITLVFLLGIGMVTMSMIVAHAPKLMFARNRPDERDSPWSKYPIWYDNVRLVGRFSEPLVTARSLMEDRDKYMLWRYEYILARIYGSLHLVKPEGLVPEKSTEFIRDRDSGLLMGVGKYNGYFV
jgi:hypothetical protein